MDKLSTMTIPSPIAKKKEIVRSENMSLEELVIFMKKHGFAEKEFADFMGVTPQGVRLWVTGQREVSVTNTRLLRMLDKYPQLIAGFKDF